MKILLFVAFAFLLPLNVWACTCDALTARQSKNNSEVVFSGEITQIDFIDLFAERNEPRIVVTFSVNEYWKGKVGKEIRLHTIYNRVSCTGIVAPKVGQKWLIYTQKYKAKDWLDRGDNTFLYVRGAIIPKPNDSILGIFCGYRSTLSEYADEDLPALGQSQIPK